MEVFFPNWREALKQFEAEMQAHPQNEAPLPAPEPAPLTPAESKPQPTVAKKPATEKKAPAIKKVAKRK